MPNWEIPPAELSDVCLKRVRELEPEADKRIKNQHVVSKVILKGGGRRGLQRDRARSTSVRIFVSSGS
jgi:hypothetical protein